MTAQKSNRKTKPARKVNLVADFISLTGITDDGQHVTFEMATWNWRNVDTLEKVDVDQITWVDRSDEEE
jgi:hypothetical protein